MGMIVIGPCKCGGYGQVFDEQAEAETGMCHRDVSPAHAQAAETEPDASDTE